MKNIFILYFYFTFNIKVHENVFLKLDSQLPKKILLFASI